jgi:hypothetical protein
VKIAGSKTLVYFCTKIHKDFKPEILHACAHLLQWLVQKFPCLVAAPFIF